MNPREAVRRLRRELITGLLPVAAARVAARRAGADASDFSVVVTVHDGFEVLRRCLDALARFAPGAEVIVVDDGSTDDATRRLIRDAAAAHGWAFRRHCEPAGHSAACNAGAGMASRWYLLLLNSDAYVTPWCWEPLRRQLSRDEVGVAGPSTSWAATSQRLRLASHCAARWSVDQASAFAWLVHLRYGRSVVPVRYVSGFALAVRRELWQRLGGFDEAFPDYGNEVELCSRVRGLELCCSWAQGAYVHHVGQQSYGVFGEEEVARRRRAGSRELRSRGL